MSTVRMVAGGTLILVGLVGLGVSPAWALLAAVFVVWVLAELEFQLRRLQSPGDDDIR